MRSMCRQRRCVGCRPERSFQSLQTVCYSGATLRKILLPLLVSSCCVSGVHGWIPALKGIVTPDWNTLHRNSCSINVLRVMRGPESHHAPCIVHREGILSSQAARRSFRRQRFFSMSTGAHEAEKDPLWLGLDLSTQSLTGAVLRGNGVGAIHNEPVVLESINFEVNLQTCWRKYMRAVS